MQTYRRFYMGKTLEISYPYDFDIENVKIEIKDKNGYNAVISINVETDFGNYLKNYFDPIPIHVKREIAQREIIKEM